MDSLWLTKAVDELISIALAEDLGSGDVTSHALLSETDLLSVALVCREDAVVCGTYLAEMVFQRMDPSLHSEVFIQDGKGLRNGDIVMQIQGRASSILSAERVALNFIQRLSGIATLTKQYVEAVKGTGVVILDTRKTTPGWRALEKYAVNCGGGCNHRQGLFDLVMIKDNHLAALKRAGVGEPIKEAVRRARLKYPHLKVEVEADNPDQVHQAIEAGADMILLDNMSTDLIQDMVQCYKGRAWFEASGGISLDTVRAYAETGVHAISIGALTHSVSSIDFGLDEIHA